MLGISFGSLWLLGGSLFVPFLVFRALHIHFSSLGNWLTRPPRPPPLVSTFGQTALVLETMFLLLLPEVCAALHP